MSIREDLKLFYSFKNYVGDYGLELEMETVSEVVYPDGFLVDNMKVYQNQKEYDLPDTLTKEWRAITDGSLRNFGIEYIFRKPLKYDEAISALENFRESIKSIKFIENSNSCSTHVHINFMKEDFLTLGNFITIWVLFENILVEYSGEHRRSNFFSLPTRAAEVLYLNIVTMFSKLSKKDPSGLSWSVNTCKYGSINLATLAKLGSLEVRTFRGTTDMNIVIKWVSVLNNILEFSRKDTTPRAILRAYRDYGPDFLFDKIFGDYADDLRSCIDCPVDEYIDNGLLYAGSIADSVRDWHSLDKIFKTEMNPKEDQPSFGSKEPQLEAYQAAAMSLDQVAGNEEHWQQLYEQATQALGGGTNPQQPQVQPYQSLYPVWTDEAQNIESDDYDEFFVDSDDVELEEEE